MAHYYVNKHAQANGDHEVHKSGCSWMPEPENRIYLGDFTSCYRAVLKAKTIYSSADGCAYCCPDCHKS
jgi:hypothetical protein